jgi:hypothetical protein
MVCMGIELVHANAITTDSHKWFVWESSWFMLTHSQPIPINGLYGNRTHDLWFTRPTLCLLSQQTVLQTTKNNF